MGEVDGWMDGWTVGEEMGDVDAGEEGFRQTAVKWEWENVC